MNTPTPQTGELIQSSPDIQTLSELAVVAFDTADDALELMAGNDKLDEDETVREFELIPGKVGEAKARSIVLNAISEAVHDLSEAAGDIPNGALNLTGGYIRSYSLARVVSAVRHFNELHPTPESE